MRTLSQKIFALIVLTSMMLVPFVILVNRDRGVEQTEIITPSVQEEVRIETPAPTTTPEEINDDVPSTTPITELPPVTPPDTPTPDPTPTPTPVAKECFKGGCSRQLCTDSPDMVSTCEWRDEYACYQSATCEQQSSGECGWTMTDTLNQCLNTAM